MLAGALLLNLPVSLEAGIGPNGATVYVPEVDDQSVVGHRVSVATEREPHQVTLSLSDPMYGAGAGVGAGSNAGLGPYYNRHVQSGDGIVSFDVVVSGNPNPDPLVVPFVVAGGTEGTHFSLPFQSPLIIPPGASSAKLYIDFITYNRWFPQRDITVTLGTAADGIATGRQVYTFYLRPTQAAPLVTWSAATASGTEEGGAITQTLTIPSVLGDDVTVYLERTGGTATLGGATPDYTTSTLNPVILAGTTSVTFTVTPVDEATVEANETAIYTIVNDARTSQVNLWSYSDYLNLTEGPAWAQGMDAGRPGDHEYVDDTVNRVGWSLDAVASGTTPDTRLPGYRYVVTSLGAGSCKIGKSINASTADELGNTVSGSEQLIPLAAENTLSVYVRKPATGFFAEFFSLDIYDRIAAVHHRGTFTWSGSAPVASSVAGLATQAVMTSQAWDNSAASNGWHRIYINAPMTSTVGNHSMRYLEAFTSAVARDVTVNRSKGVEFAWPQFEQGSATPTAYQRCEGSHWDPWGGCTLGATPTCTFTITNTDS